MNPFDIDAMVKKAKDGDAALRNELVDSNKGFIRRTASYICKRSLDWSNDDELSIALMAFNEAIDSFDGGRGKSFLSYCRTIINSRLIDYFRKNSSSCLSIESIGEEELSSIESKEAIDRYSISYAAEERSAEIKMYNKELSQYGLSFADLVANCPKHRDTRKTLFEMAAVCKKSNTVMEKLKRSRTLAIKEIMELTGAKRKLIEQWRKYIIAILIIVSSDEYIYLSEYIDFDDKKAVV